jgi:membrane associated rhomboid family serine protease
MSFLEKNNRYYHLVQIIILFNIIVYFICKLFPHIMVYMSLNIITIFNGYFWQFITYMFIHTNILHLFFNVLALFIIGVPVEK